MATGADYLGFQFAGADYLASAIRRGRLPGPAKRWGRIPGPNFRQKAGQITWAGRLPGPRPKAGQNTCLHVFRSVATQAPNRTKPVRGVFLRAAWPGMTNGRGKGRRGPGSAAYANERRDKNGLLYRDKARARTVKEQPDTGRSARRSQIESLKDDTYILCSGPSIGTMKRLPWQGDLLRRPARYPMDGRARP